MVERPPLVAGQVGRISPLVRRVLEPNPGVMTGPGTNTYLIGPDGGDVAVIDPGEDDAAHLDLVAAAGEGHIRWILVTHTHSDHSPGAAGLKARTGAQVLGWSERDGFSPDTLIADDFVLPDAGFTLRAIHTPGHASNHLCYLLEDEKVLFSGDHVMSGSTVVIAPPDGDMAAYFEALERLRGFEVATILPGHGDVIEDPTGKVDEYLTHRRAREEAISAALGRAGTATVEQLVEAVYTDVPDHLHPIARYSVWAHLRKLAADGRATTTDPDDLASEWQAAPR
ncbi:MAG TPA: MBL fold metallo-hydrolase [Acidimicrobiales bacterium]|nr:MBL fold metallo-hydrolase [Acidimicrobiales bacterium]